MVRYTRFMKTDNLHKSNSGLHFEETKLTKMTKTAKETPVKAKKSSNIKTKFASVQKNVVAKFKGVKPLKSVKKLTKAQRLERKNRRNRVIMGIGLMLVVVSIAYSTTVTRYFVDSPASLLFLAPQVIFAVITIIIAFSKLYK